MAKNAGGIKRNKSAKNNLTEEELSDRIVAIRARTSKLQIVGAVLQISTVVAQAILQIFAPG
jgi:hypothetical protein